MKERPILFSGPMVRAILEGRKTQARRVVRFDPASGYIVEPGGKRRWHRDDADAVQGCPYGALGDRLWVRETFQEFFDDEFPTDRPRGPKGTMGCPATPERESRVFYRADGGAAHDQLGQPCWRPSIHMPRWASRILLEITEVRVQRLQEITAEDAVAEGAQRFTGLLPDFTGGHGPSWSMGAPTSHGECLGTARFAFANFWNRAVRVAELDWDSNPWVWAITFGRVEQ